MTEEGCSLAPLLILSNFFTYKEIVMFLWDIIAGILEASVPHTGKNAFKLFR